MRLRASDNNDYGVNWHSQSKTPALSNSDSEEDVSDDGQDLIEDPLYRPLEDMFDVSDSDVGAADAPPGDDNPLPPAFYEHRVIRNSYVHAFVNAAYKGATHAQTQAFLTSTHSTIKTMIDLAPPDTFDVDLDGMARTLRTVEKRLGVDPDDLIIYYILCTKCWSIYHPSTLPDLPVHCSFRNCSSKLYTLKRLSDGTSKKVPLRTVPFASLRKAIANMLNRPMKWEEINHWRQPGDTGPALPVSREEFYANLDTSRPLCDIYDGWLWRSLKTGFVRTWDPRRLVVTDVDVKQLDTRFVNLTCGIVIHCNLDWYDDHTYNHVLSLGCCWCVDSSLHTYPGFAR